MEASHSSKKQNQSEEMKSIETLQFHEMELDDRILKVNKYIFL